LLAAVAAGSFLFGKGEKSGYEPVPNLSGPTFTPVTNLEVDGLAPAERSLAEDARKAGASEASVNDLITASDQLETQSAGLRTLQGNPAQAAAATARADEMKRAASAANMAFTAALLHDAEARAQRLSSDAPSASRASVNNALAELRAAVQGAADATDPAQSLNAARDALGKSQGFALTLQAANRRAGEALAQQTAKKTVVTAKPVATITTAATVKPTVKPVAKPETPAAASSVSLSPGKIGQFNAIIDGARGMAKQVMRMGSGSSNSTRRANAGLAKNYDRYLANLKDSGRGIKTDKDADRLIKQANQTKAYIVFLNKQSSSAQ
ncbi:MAG: hypothetical protein ABIW03_00815, partial [Sphingomicrobium sp.]